MRSSAPHEVRRLDSKPAEDAPAGYPEGWDGHVVLRDGGLAFLRPVRPDDADALEELHAHLSSESKYLRYFTARRTLPETEIERSVRVDYRERMAFVAFVQGRLAGYACYVRSRPEVSAEIAFQVEDAQQGRGLGTLLLEQLAAYAHEQGLHHFEASVLPQNRRMIEVFRDAGFPRRLHRDDGVVEVRLDIDPTRHSRDAIARRHTTALANARERLADAKRDRP